MPSGLPDGLIAYGPNSNCTLELCQVDWSVLGYRPSVPASAVFMAIFGVALVIHAVLGFRWRHTLTSFAIPIILGLIDEVIGYGGRIMLYNNPFSFSGFLIEIICITTAPVFYCAAIYVTLARTINYLDRSLSRFNPKFLYWFFIPCDVVSLVFQAAGGALSSTSSGSNATGVNMSLFGLSFQVFTLVVFIAFAGDYLVRYHLRLRRDPGSLRTLDAHAERRVRIFLVFLSAAILFILIRCVYRIDELSSGYFGSLFHNEGIFYGLESSMIVVAVFCLSLGHPGFGLQTEQSAVSLTASGTEQSIAQEAKPASV